MSKFVTYGVTEMLDNDQKFIIDSDRTGPGSITAKDAASSLLSKWAGFETFEEAVQNTIEHNQEFIDRDTAIREETAELKKKIVTTFPAKDASGQIATFDSEFKDAPLKSCIVRVEPVQDLHGYDSPWPAGGGKNLFDASILTEQASWKTVILDLPSGTYTMSTNKGGSAATGLALVFRKTGDTTIGANNTVYDGSPITKTIADGETLEIVFRQVSGEESFATYHYQIEEGSTATDWTPYENICPITGWTGCEVQRTGKNLIPLNIWSGFNYKGSIGKVFTPTISDKSWTQVESSITYETTATYTTLSLMTPLLHKGTYHLGLHKLSTNSLRYSRYTLDKSFTVKQSDYMSNVTNVSVAITLDEDGYIAFYLDNGSTASQTVEITIQVEVGDTESAYEPYQGDTYPITFPTEAGTVYGAYVDATGGELVVDRAMVDLGSLNWSTNSNNRAYINNFTTAYGCALPQSAYNVAGCIAEQYKEVPASGSLTLGTFAILQVEAIYFYYDGTNLPTGKMVFPLATPIHYPLTSTEIKTLLGTNNVWANTGDTAVEYLMSDVGWYVEKKLRAFQSILAGVEDSETSSKNYSANTYLIFNNDIYRVTKAITTGETIEEGVNVTKTTVAEQLMALAQA